MSDASFHDSGEKPLRLIAQGAEDLPVLSALLQDAVGTAGDVAWLRARRRFALFLGRFRNTNPMARGIWNPIR